MRPQHSPSPQELLQNVLSQKAETQQMPYKEKAKWPIRQAVLDLAQDFPTLLIKQENYTYPSGSTFMLLKAEGTLPMVYQGVKYNIPVCVWLPEQFPWTAPILYVVPTPDMIIKPRHSFVDPSGLAMTPYLRHWTYSQSNLCDMAHDTSIQFGQDPPLFSKPPGWTSSPPPQQPPRPSPTQHPPPPHMGAYDTFHAENPMRSPNSSFSGPPGIPRPSSSSAMQNGYAEPHQMQESIWSGAVAAAGNSFSHQHQPRAHPSPPPVRPPEPPKSRPNLDGVFKEAAIQALTRRLQGSLSAMNATAASEVDSAMETQAKLAQRGEALESAVAGMQAERRGLESTVLELSGKTTALTRWLAENESKLPEGTEFDADTAIVPADSLSRQALEAQAKDMAIEDALYALDKALQHGTITSEAYLKQVRLICRRQFFVRALGHKIAAQQNSFRGR
ncbi:hypothetical protein WJX84_010622 [Apatococcus fuscideae]|uniref:Tumor susceptibility gene 101 protein n=1 Tax=Apatococcus fuscideae TaxID=2026836 RepID=A0AAW1SYQ2_9CHLO